MGRSAAHGSHGEDGYDARINISLHRKKVERLSAVEDVEVGVSVSELEHAIEERGLDRVMVVRAEDKDGLNMLIPEDRLGFDALERYVDPALEIPTIDVETQGEGPLMSLQDLKAYFGTSEKSRSQMLNVVSFNLGYTGLDGHVVPPAVVRDMDLVGRCWPSGHVRYQEDDNPFSETHMRTREEAYSSPKTLAYLLMGPAGAYTDWHVDMGGSSVWYHVIRGSKIFMAAPDTEYNKAQFLSWSSSEEQVETFLGDRLEKCVRLRLMPGDTLFLPGGWFHAVSTPVDSLVVGGNFINAYRLKNALGVVDIERKLRVESDAQYPKFKMLLFYAACDVVRRSQRWRAFDGDDRGTLAGLSRTEIESLPFLAKYLGHFVRKRRTTAKQQQVKMLVGILWDEIERYRDTLGDEDSSSSEKAKENKQPSPEVASPIKEDRDIGTEQRKKKRKVQVAPLQEDSIIDLTGEASDGDTVLESQRAPGKTMPRDKLLPKAQRKETSRLNPNVDKGFLPKYDEKVFASQTEEIRMKALRMHAAVASNIVQEHRLKKPKQPLPTADGDAALKKAVERKLTQIEKLVRQLESDHRVYSQHQSGEILLKDQGARVRKNLEILSEELNRKAREFLTFVDENPAANAHVNVLMSRFSKIMKYMKNAHDAGHAVELPVSTPDNAIQAKQPDGGRKVLRTQFKLTPAGAPRATERTAPPTKEADTSSPATVQNGQSTSPPKEADQHLMTEKSHSVPEKSAPAVTKEPLTEDITRASTPRQTDAPKQPSAERSRIVMDSRTLRVALNVLRQENRYMTAKEITRFALEQGMLDFRNDLGDCIGFELSVESQEPNSRVSQVNCRYGLKDWSITT